MGDVIMVSMKNIKLEDGVISFVCFAENDPNQSFTVKLDANDFHVIENSLGGMNTYCRMAINKVISTLVEEKKLPLELYSYWC
jgi:hypothetical protein